MNMIQASTRTQSGILRARLALPVRMAIEQQPLLLLPASSAVQVSALFSEIYFCRHVALLLIHACVWEAVMPLEAARQSSPLSHNPRFVLLQLQFAAGNFSSLDGARCNRCPGASAAAQKITT